MNEWPTQQIKCMDGCTGRPTQQIKCMDGCTGKNQLLTSDSLCTLSAFLQ